MNLINKPWHTDGQKQSTTTDSANVPHPTDPLLTVTGLGGIGLAASDTRYAAGDNHTELAVERHYTGVAGQSETLTLVSQNDLTMTAKQGIDFAAVKKVVIKTKTAAGTCIEIGKSGINVTAPGSLTVHAAAHEFVSGGGVNYWLPMMPKGIFMECLKRARSSGSPFATR